MKLSLSTGLAAGFLALASAPAASATPLTVDLRIEGPTRTLFEGPVTTDVRPFNFTGDVAHECDGSPPAPAPAVTRGAVIAAAAQATPFTIGGAWSTDYGSPSFIDIAGESVAYDSGTGRFLAEYENGALAQVGACDDTVAAGDRVLFAYANGSEPLLALSGPATAKPGESVTLKVTDAATGAGVAGATVGDRQSAADGTVAAGPWNDRGSHDLKAAKSGAIRSNGTRVCVSDGADGACGTSLPGASRPQAPATPVVPDRTPPAGTLAGFTDHQVFSRGPRELRGSFAADASGIKTVKLRLTRRAGKRCWYFSGRSERFRGTRCGRGAYFAIGDRADWSYLLPARLGPGRYVLDAVAIDGAGNRTPLARGSSRVVFRVR